MERIAERIRELAQRICKNESMEQGRCSCKVVCGISLQRENIIRIKIESVCIESTRVKVHPDGTGALKKTEFKALGAREEGLQQKFIWLRHAREYV
jgi:hypothetical protein